MNIVGTKHGKMKNRIICVFLFSLVTILFAECKRTSKDLQILGEQYKSASSSFYVVGSNPKLIFRAYSSISNDTVNTVNFFVDSLYFKAKFSESVSWGITIKGLTSGAVKSFNGLSDSISISNSKWDGSADGYRFFQKGENAVAVLSILGSSISYSDTFNVFIQKIYKGTLNGVKYTPIDDFDGNGTYPLAAVTPDQKDTDIIFTTDTNLYVNGTHSYRMRANDANWNSYDGAITTTNLYDLNNGAGVITIKDPAQLYFNLYIYGTGTPQTSVAVELFENEMKQPSVYNQSLNDAYIYHIPVDWIGWRLVSVPYIDFKKAPDPKAGGNGNGVKEPWLVSGVSVTLESYPTAGKTIEAYVDVITLTEGDVFRP